MKGSFIFSIDLELAWGTKGKPAYLPAYREERAVMRRLCDLADEYAIPLTVATVGMLFLPSLKDARTRAQWLGRGREMRARFEDGCEESLWFAPDIIRDVLARRTPHEIGCHTCYHTLADETDPASFRAELEESSGFAREEFGVELTSFVYPRNLVHDLEALAAAGRTAYRSPDPDRFAPYPTPLRQVFHCVEAYAGAAARVGKARRQDGLVALPGSYFLPRQPRGALQIPRNARLRTLRRGLEDARDGAALHVWLHPFNITQDAGAWFAVISALFRMVADRREKGDIEPLTMRDAAARI